MSDPYRRPDRQGHPIILGVIALVGVTGVVGGALAGGALVATRALGVNDAATATDTHTKDETLSIPPLTASDLGQDEENYLTLSTAPSASTTPTSKYTTSSEPAGRSKAITLVAGETAVSAMGRLDLSGTYPTGGGSILQVEQKVNGGDWGTFPITMDVHDDGTFSTYIQTGQVGANKFRVVDTTTQEKSNAVSVTIG